MSTIKVDKGVELPPPAVNRAGAPPKYPWRSMDIGDSFFVDKKPDALNGTINHARKETGFRFARRSAIENGVKGTRVWRIE